MITSRTNPLVKEFRKRKRENHDEKRCAILEGVRLIKESLKENLLFEIAFFTPGLLSQPRGELLLKELKSKVAACYEVSEEVMESLSLEETPPGVLAYARIPHRTIFSAGSFLVLCGIRDPGNAGSLIRTAEGAGVGVWLSLESVHPLQAKVVKASMGSIFRVPVERGPIVPFLQKIKEKKIPILGTKARGGIPYDQWNWKEPFAVILGGEAEGIPENASPFVENWISIPIEASLDSLNVAAAGAVILFEAKKQIKAS